MPGEAEKTAAHLGITLEKLFEEKLVINWFENLNGEEMFVLSPAVTKTQPGGMADGDPRGTCVFLKDGLCSIHVVKPHECAMYNHVDSPAEVATRHRAVAEAWRSHQPLLKSLLGEEPEVSPFYGGPLGFLFEP